MKVLNPLKAPFGKGKASPIKDVSYRQWEDAFEVEFDEEKNEMAVDVLQGEVGVSRLGRTRPFAKPTKFL